MEITPWISIAENHQPGRRISSTRDGLPIEVAIRDRVRGFIETLVEAELDEALGRSRYQRPGTADQAGRIAGSRHGRRECELLGSFGPEKTACRAHDRATPTGRAGNGTVKRCHAMRG